MRAFTALAIIIGSSPLALEAQGGLDLAPSRMEDFAAHLLLNSNVRQRDIPRPKGVNADLYVVRLYEVPELGGCEEDTEAICLRHYGLLLAAGGMPGEVALYDLGSVGEITDVQWVASPTRDTLQRAPMTILGRVTEATFVVTVQNYPSLVLSHSPALHRVVKRYRITAAPQQIAVHEIP